MTDPHALARLGTCPDCGAKDGEPCDPRIGVHVGKPTEEDGVHLERLQAAVDAMESE